MSLYYLLDEERSPDSAVAWVWDSVRGEDRRLGWTDFRGHVASLMERLDGRSDGAWLVVTEDAYAFAVALMALWQAGRSAISPPNHQPGTLLQLQTRASGVLSDRAEWFAEGACLHPLSGGACETFPVFAPLRPELEALELYTSGTTGAEKPVGKRLSHLVEEVRELETTWGGGLEECVVFSTASHQHLYGLLFGVLWPLFAGRAFHGDHFLHSGELIRRMQALGDCVLASVPVHLKRIVKQAGVEVLRDRCRMVFSSGGPLAATTAHAVARTIGHAPIEVLGSTETGGVAWRAQRPGAGEVPWTPLGPVSVAADERGVARVKSPFVSTGDGSPMGDRIELLPDGRFVLQGRADRVVKVGEKRLDLARLESELRAHPFVADAALLLLDQEGAERVAAVVAPTAVGWGIIRDEGRRVFGQALVSSLAEGWDRVLLPRLWRSVQRLPENARGKTTLEALRALFERPAEDVP